jgi:hexosaminidase
MKSRKSIYLLLLLLSISCSRHPGQDISIIPLPAEMENTGPGRFRLSENTIIQFDQDVMNAASFFNDYCREIYGIDLKSMSSDRPGKKSNIIRLQYVKDLPPGQYRLSIKKRGIMIQGSEDGVFYGIQTLIQLLPSSPEAGQKSLEVPYVRINDQPRFSYRGMLLDVGRYFLPVDFLKKCIDYAAYHKINYFHLHLTDDQGWRIEIRKYPRLTEVGAWRQGTIIGLWPGTGNDSIPHGGYYTQDEIRELVAYAQDRYVTLIPEIEMPAHSLSALASYPYLGCTGGPYQVREIWGTTPDVFCAGNDSTFEFLQDVLDEVMDLFPSQYIHVGGDECRKDRWNECDKCQMRIKTENLKDEDELQSYFIKRIEKHINSRARTLIGWDEILEGGVAPNAVVMSWRGNGEAGCLGAVKAGNQVIMTPSYSFYLDYPQTSQEDSLAADWGGVTPVSKVYGYEPVLEQLSVEEAALVIGAQANIWTEYMNNPAKVEYMAFPRLSAVSEVLWSPAEVREWDDFRRRMESQYKKYNLWGVAYNPAELTQE